MEIIRACKDDLPEILILQRLAFYRVGLRYNDPDTPPLPQTLDELVEESDGQVFLKAVQDGKIIGAIRGKDNGNSCRISKVMVHPDHQDRGIGRKLVNAIEKEFNVPMFDLRTGHLDEVTISLYKKLGYVLTGEKEQITETLWFVRMKKEMPGRGGK
ncbi:MAG: GNAT family N-acetyltransferase [Methanomassiliicoccaceae archaeon]|nr:GNAT family N-acetyltransferase [Methanomassiliicoccaceae archaeon]